jgi:hypothetical protein
LGAWKSEHRLAAPRRARSQRITLAVLGALFAVGVASGLHGFSIGGWRAFIGDEPALTPLFGEPRGVRSDDWAVQIPLGLAQRAHDPPFPVVNTNIGAGQNMLAPVQAPVADAVALFRPALWGYFLGGDTGIAWMWWFELLGLIAVWSGVFVWVGRGQAALGIAAAVALAFAPFFQYWSLNAAPAVIYTGLAVLAAQLVFASARLRDILVGGALLGWATGAFGLVLYPPAMAVLAQCGLVLAACGLASCRGAATADSVGNRLGWRVAALAGAAAITAGAAWLFLDGAHDVLALVSGSVYPGARIATGGELAWWQPFTANLWLAWWTDDFGPLLNICEAASFPLYYPLIGMALGWRWWRHREFPDPLAVALLGYCVFLAAYQAVGFPEWLARATGLGFAPGRRTLLGSGLADALLLVRFLSAPRSAEPTRVGGRGAAATLALAWAAFLVAVAVGLARALPALPLAPLIALACVNAAIAYAILALRRPDRLMVALAAAAIVGTAWFNPLARGGGDALRDSRLAAAILEIDAELAGESVFVTYGSAKLPNLVWALGVHGLNGTLTAPQLDTWRKLDPLRRSEDVYNRYAHVEFALGRNDVARFRLVRHDSMRVTLNPLAPALRRDLGATHVLLRAKPEDRERFERATGLVPRFVAQRNAIYALPPLQR